MNLAHRITFIAVTIIPLSANAQTAEQAGIVPKTESNTRPIEEIEVRGQRTLISMRYQLRLAEDSLYKPVARKPWLTVYRAHAGLHKNDKNKSKKIANFEGPFTPRGWLRLA